MSDNDKKSTKPSRYGEGIAIGAALGVSLGIAMDNMPLGIAMGVGIGTALGSSLGTSSRDCAITRFFLSPFRRRSGNAK